MTEELKTQVLEAIACFCGQSNMLTIPRELIRFCDNDVETALFLSQLIYWTPRAQEGIVAKSALEWEEELGLSPRKLQKGREWCHRQGFLELTLRRFKGSPTVHYQLNVPVFQEQLLSFLQRQQAKMQNGICKMQNGFVQNDKIHFDKTHKSSTETTPETTTDSLPFPELYVQRFTPGTPSHENGLSGFAEFWQHYPKKRAKGKAEAAWRKHHCASRLEAILSALAAARASPDWQKEDGRFIPWPAKWLDGKGWEDEYGPAADHSLQGEADRLHQKMEELGLT